MRLLNQDPLNSPSRFTTRNLSRLVRPVLAVCFIILISSLIFFASRPSHHSSSLANPTPNPALPTVRMERISAEPAFAIRDVVFRCLFQFPTIFMTELAAVIFLSRKRVKRRLLWVITSYLLLICVAMAFALLARDEFGFSFIPVAFTVWPWYHILSRVPGPSSMGITGLLLELALGALLNCAILLLTDRLSYPKHSTELSDRHAT
jgi:hypothetical protein